jgi:hypothetical protein
VSKRNCIQGFIRQTASAMVGAKKDKKWIQKAVPESREGKFGTWCKSHGFKDGVCQGCIDKAVAAGGQAQKMALFAVNVSHGKYTYPKS